MIIDDSFCLMHPVVLAVIIMQLISQETRFTERVLLVNLLQYNDLNERRFKQSVKCVLGSIWSSW